MRHSFTSHWLPVTDQRRRKTVFRHAQLIRLTVSIKAATDIDANRCKYSPLSRVPSRAREQTFLHLYLKLPRSIETLLSCYFVFCKNKFLFSFPSPLNVVVGKCQRTTNKSKVTTRNMENKFCIHDLIYK